MRLPILVSITSIILGVSALPFAIKRAAIDDTTVLNFALTLEHLESAFYQEGLSKFSQQDFLEAGLPAFARGRFTQIAANENAHVALLEKTLGDKATKPCTYNFGVNDPKSFAALAQALEDGGVSAYSGAAQLITSKEILTTAATILSTEARQASWLRSAVNKGSGWSGPFDVPLDMNEIFSIAGSFIVSCPPTNPTLPVKAFPPLTIDKPAPGSVSTLSFNPASPTSGQLFVAFLTGLDTIFVPVQSGKVAIPEELLGVVYAVVTTSSNSAADDKIVAGPAILDFDFDSTGKLRAQ